MSVLRRETVQLHCRTCLCDLQTKVDEIGLPRRWYHIQTTDNLAEWIQNLTSLRVLTAASQDFPQFVCQECYEKFKDFQEFQKVVLNAADQLHSVVMEPDTDAMKTLDAASFVKPELHYEEETEELDGYLNKNSIEERATASTEIKIQETFEKFNTQFINQNMGAIENCNEPLDVNDELLSGDELSGSQHTYKCEQCNRRYSHRYTYIAHIRQDHQGISHAFECEHCHKGYTNFCNLYRHLRLEHSMALRQFKCEYPNCKRSFRHLTSRRKHYQEYHQRMKRPPTPPTPPDSTLLLPELLLSTELAPTQPKRFTCSLCSDQYETLYNLQNHMVMHRDDMKFVCNICGKRKISQVKLDEHYATVHDPKNAYPCNICHKVFKCKSHVSVHIMSVHKGLRPYACHYCPMQFAAKNTLKIHERLHTGEKPFACEICGRRFTQLTPMKKHRLIHEKARSQHHHQPQHQQQQELLAATTSLSLSGYAAFGN